MKARNLLIVSKKPYLSNIKYYQQLFPLCKTIEQLSYLISWMLAANLHWSTVLE